MDENGAVESSPYGLANILARFSNAVAPFGVVHVAGLDEMRAMSEPGRHHP